MLAMFIQSLRQDNLFLFDMYFSVLEFSEILHQISHLNHCIEVNILFKQIWTKPWGSMEGAKGFYYHLGKLYNKM